MREPLRLHTILEKKGPTSYVSEALLEAPAPQNGTTGRHKFYGFSSKTATQQRFIVLGDQFRSQCNT